MGAWGRSLLLAAVGLPSAACEAEVGLRRAQAVVVVDTDLPIVGQLRDRPELSADAAIDSVRIDVLEEDGSRADFLDVVAPEPVDWPISFGVAAEGSRRVRLQIRAFKGRFADRGELHGKATLEPEPEITIDRVVDLELPSDHVETVRITLRGDCLGVPPTFGDSITTCIDGARPDGDPSEGVESDADRTGTAVGTWPRALEQPCARPDDDATVCVEGGFTLLGDEGFAGFEDGATYAVSPTPVRPVTVSPFRMDRTEVTVGRFQTLVAAGLVVPDPPQEHDPTSEFLRYCNLGAEGSLDRPLNCVTKATARAACQAAGGDLPSEAQWEHAARGRGAGHPYPWGSAAPECCALAAARCVDGTSDVGAHLGEGCAAGDVSRDGAVDLGGNVQELTLDSLVSYDDPCWTVRGVLLDPVCETDAVEGSVVRGASWASPHALVHAALRGTAYPTHEIGFRCVYRDAP